MLDNAEMPALTFGDFDMSPSIGTLMEALSKAQGAMPAPVKNKKNPHFGSYYADHASVIECSKPHMAANGLGIVQGLGFKDGRVIITTILGHASGQWIRSRLSLQPDKPTPQGAGSAITYGRRYAHCAILNMAPDDDDDGNEASPPPKTGGQGKQAEKKPEVYMAADHQRLKLKEIFDELGVTDDGEMVRIAKAAAGTPMLTLRAFVEGKINAGNK